MAETIASSVFLIAMGVWLGGVVFFSFFTAPVIFERLPRNQAADLIAVIFPRYYNLGYACGFAMMGAAGYPLYRDFGDGLLWISWLIALVATVLSLYAGKLVMPNVRRLRMTASSSAGTPEHTQNRDAYHRAHQLSITLNSLVLILLLTETLLQGYRFREMFPV